MGVAAMDWAFSLCLSLTISEKMWLNSVLDSDNVALFALSFVQAYAHTKIPPEDRV